MNIKIIRTGASLDLMSLFEFFPVDVVLWRLIMCTFIKPPLYSENKAVLWPHDILAPFKVFFPYLFWTIFSLYSSAYPRTYVNVLASVLSHCFAFRHTHCVSPTSLYLMASKSWHNQHLKLSSDFELCIFTWHRIFWTLNFPVVLGTYPCFSQDILHQLAQKILQNGACEEEPECVVLCDLRGMQEFI